MKSALCVVPMVLIALGIGSVFAADRAAADSLAASGIVVAGKGNAAQARELFYKALANDETCPDAIFELAKIFDKENNPAAASDFYQRASLLMAQENKSATLLKRAEANARVKALNPFAPKVSALYEDYAQQLDNLTKKVSDSVTQEAAMSRVDDLKLSSVLPPEKMPKFYAAAQAQKAAAATAAETETKKPARRSSAFDDDFSTRKAATSVPPEVERELKALGWATITGTWVKKSQGVYEVTDGKLEAAKTNGAVDVWVGKGNSGTVKAAVRNDFGTEGATYFSEYTGYGLNLTRKDCRILAPSSYSGFGTFGGSRYEPMHYNTVPVPDANPKNHMTVQVTDGLLEFTLNDKKLMRNNDAKLPRGGPFVIEIKGSAILENPRCGGQ